MDNNKSKSYRYGLKYKAIDSLQKIERSKDTDRDDPKEFSVAGLP